MIITKVYKSSSLSTMMTSTNFKKNQLKQSQIFKKKKIKKLNF